MFHCFMLALALSPESGPAAGTAVPPLPALRVQETLGDPEDLAALRKDQPTLYAFVPKDKWDRPTARFLRTLDAKLADVPDAQIVFVWVSPDRAADGAEYLRRVQESLKLQRTMWAAVQGEPGDVKNWELNPDATVTLVVARGGKVIKSLGYSQIDEAEATKVVKLFK